MDPPVLVGGSGLPRDVKPLTIYQMYYSAFVISEDQRVAFPLHTAFVHGRSQRIDGDEFSMTHAHTNVRRGGHWGLPKWWWIDIERVTAFADRDLSKVVDSDERPLLDAMKLRLQIDPYGSPPDHDLLLPRSLGNLMEGYEPDSALRLGDNTPYWMEGLYKGWACDGGDPVDVMATAQKIVERCSRRAMDDIAALEWPAPSMPEDGDSSMEPWDPKENAIARAKQEGDLWLHELRKHKTVRGRTTVWFVIEGPGEQVVV